VEFYQLALGFLRMNSVQAILHFLFGICAVSHSGRHLTGTSSGAPLSLTKMTTIFADLVVLAFRSRT
jgi:hypothetical protein